MNVIKFQFVCSCAVRRFQEDEGVSSEFLAERLGFSLGTFYAKRGNYRRWNVSDLLILAGLGVVVPDFNEFMRIVGNRSSK